MAMGRKAVRLHFSQSPDMPKVVTSVVGRSILIGLAFACWFTASGLVPMASEWWFVITYLVSGLAFFVAGCFLPEFRDRRLFLDRRAALQVMAFFFWLSGSSVGLMPSFREVAAGTTWINVSQTFGALAFAFASYFLATFLIRGFRAPVGADGSPPVPEPPMAGRKSEA
jgi:hypothetical protein